MLNPNPKIKIALLLRKSSKVQIYVLIKLLEMLRKCLERLSKVSQETLKRLLGAETSRKFFMPATSPDVFPG